MTIPTYGLKSIIWDGTKWVAGSTAHNSKAERDATSNLFSSSDAATWTPVAYLDDPFGGPREDYNATSPYDGTRFAAGDPIDIANVPNGTQPAIIESHIKRYTKGIKFPYSTGAWVAYGTNPTWTKGVAVSYNTTTGAYTDSAGVWIKTTLPTAARWSNIAYGNNRWVAVSGDVNAADNKSIISTSDGKGWTAYNLPATLSWQDITYKNNRFITVGGTNSNQAAYLVDDSTTWATSYLPSSGNWRTISSIDNYAIAFKLASNSIARTSDGISWTSATLPISGSWIDSEFGYTKSTKTNLASTHTDVAVYSNVIAHEVPIRSFTGVRTSNTQFNNIQPTPYELVGTHDIVGTIIEPVGWQETAIDAYGPRYTISGAIIGYTGTPAAYYWLRGTSNITATVGQQFAFSGTSVGGTTANNGIITCTSVDGNGYMNTATVTGTPPTYSKAQIRVNISTSGSNLAFTYSIVFGGSKYTVGQQLNLSSAGDYVRDANNAWPVTVTSVDSNGAVTGITGGATSAPQPTAPTLRITVAANGTFTTSILNGGTGFSGGDNWRIQINPFGTALLYTVNTTSAGVITGLSSPTETTVFTPCKLQMNLSRAGSIVPVITSQGVYPDGTKLKIFGSQVGGVDSTNDIIYSVKADSSGTFIDDLILFNTPVIPAMPTFNVTRDKTVFTAITLNTTRPGYKIGDLITLEASDLLDYAGNSPVLSVTGVDGSKNITTFTKIFGDARYVPEVRFNVTRTGSTYTATLATQTLNYRVYPGAQFRIHAIDLGGTSPVLTPDAYQTNANDAIIDVLTVTALDYKGDNTIATFAISGTGKVAIESTFDVFRNRKVYSATENFSGSGFVPGQQITIQGTLVDGYSPQHNVTVTVNSIKTVLRGGVYQSGVIATYTTTGTGIDGAIVAISAANGNQVVRSVDGITWTTETLPSSVVARSIAWGESTFGGVYVLVADNTNTYFTSVDGKTWLSHTLSYSSAWRDVIFLNGAFNVYDNSRYGINNTLTGSFDADGWLEVEENYESPWTTTQIDTLFYSGGKYYGFGSGYIAVENKTVPLLWISSTLSGNKGDWSIYPATGITQLVSATDTGTEILVTDGSKIYALPSDLGEGNTDLIVRAGPFGEPIEKIQADDGYVYAFTTTKTLISSI